MMLMLMCDVNCQMRQSIALNLNAYWLCTYAKWEHNVVFEINDVVLCTAGYLSFGPMA
jgi:hypothetical protein